VSECSSRTSAGVFARRPSSNGGNDGSAQQDDKDSKLSPEIGISGMPCKTVHYQISHHRPSSSSVEGRRVHAITFLPEVGTLPLGVWSPSTSSSSESPPTKVRKLNKYTTSQAKFGEPRGCQSSNDFSDTFRTRSGSGDSKQSKNTSRRCDSDSRAIIKSEKLEEKIDEGVTDNFSNILPGRGKPVAKTEDFSLRKRKGNAKCGSVSKTVCSDKKSINYCRSNSSTAVLNLSQIETNNQDKAFDKSISDSSAFKYRFQSNSSTNTMTTPPRPNRADSHSQMNLQTSDTKPLADREFVLQQDELIGESGGKWTRHVRNRSSTVTSDIPVGVAWALQRSKAHSISACEKISLHTYLNI